MTALPFGQGHGVAGKFGGLPDEYSSLEHSQIVILPVPFDKTTTYQQGAERGPGALIEASRNMELYDIETNSEVYRKGIHTAEEIITHSSEEMLKKLYDQTSHFLHMGKFVATLGGEHSISSAPIRAHTDFHGELVVLQFDAHADLQEAYEGNPYSHASVMARVKENEKVSRIVSVGIRSMSSEELRRLDRRSTYCAHEIPRTDDWMEDVLGQLSSKVYITFDLDVFDSSIMPSTGTPEPGGLDWRQITKLLKLVFQQRNVVGMDIVELLPNPTNVAPDFLAAKLLYKCLSYKFP